MNVKPPPVTPGPLTIGQALDASVALGRIRENLRDSRARFEAVQSAIPTLMMAHVRPGPVAADGWSLLADNSAVAAKLRQLEPRILACLASAGWSTGTLVIRVARDGL
jgi:hypothetical protein